MTKTEKKIDYAKLFGLLDEQQLKDVGVKLAEQAINNTPVEYQEFDIKLKIPVTVVQLLETLTEIFPVEMELILSKMASQGVGNILQGVTTPLHKDDMEIKNPLDNIEPINKISDQLSDLQSVIGQFSNMQKIFGDLSNGTSLNNTEQDKKDL
jgi:hypothetical protein